MYSGTSLTFFWSNEALMPSFLSTVSNNIPKFFLVHPVLCNLVFETTSSLTTDLFKFRILNWFNLVICHTGCWIWILPVIMETCLPRWTLSLSSPGTCLHGVISGRTTLKKIPDIFIKCNYFRGPALKVPFYPLDLNLLCWYGWLKSSTPRSSWVDSLG